jgi:hypothetical protein
LLGLAWVSNHFCGFFARSCGVVDVFPLFSAQQRTTLCSLVLILVQGIVGPKVTEYLLPADTGYWCLKQWGS